MGQAGTTNLLWLTAGGSVDNTYLLAYGSYDVTFQFWPGWGNTPSNQVDSVAVFVDGNSVSTFNANPLNGGTYTIFIGTLSPGEHGIGLVDTAPVSNFPLALGPGHPIETVTYANPPTLANPGFEQPSLGAG